MEYGFTVLGDTVLLVVRMIMECISTVIKIVVVQWQGTREIVPTVFSQMVSQKEERTIEFSAVRIW